MAMGNVYLAVTQLLYAISREKFCSKLKLMQTLEFTLRNIFGDQTAPKILMYVVVVALRPKVTCLYKICKLGI